jgi:excisionase family DNA binding protein
MTEETMTDPHDQTDDAPHHALDGLRRLQKAVLGAVTPPLTARTEHIAHLAHDLAGSLEGAAHTLQGRGQSQSEAVLQDAREGAGDLLSVREAAQQAGISSSTVYTWIRKGKVSTMPGSDGMLVSLAAVRALAAQRRQTGEATE